MIKIHLLHLIFFLASTVFPFQIRYNLLHSHDIDHRNVGNYFSFILNADTLTCSICDICFTLGVKEYSDTMQLKRSGKGTSLLLENRSETLVMEKFKLVEIKMDSMIFGYPVPGYLKKETACKNRYLFLKIHKDNIAALAAHTKAPLLFALAGMEAATLTMSSLSFWKYGDETLGALYSTSGVLYLSVPIVFNEDKNNSYFEAIGGSWGLTYACGLLLLGGLNFAFGDTYSRKEVFWGNIIGFNATIALSIGAGMIEMNFKRKIE